MTATSSSAPGTCCRTSDGADAWTVALGAASIALLVTLNRVARQLPSTLIVLVLGIAVSALLDLQSHGVSVVGELPSAFPDPALPDVGWSDLVDLLPAALGMVIVTAEAAGVSRTIANSQGYDIDVNRDLIALGGSNIAAGLSTRLRAVGRREPDDGRGARGGQDRRSPRSRRPG